MEWVPHLYFILIQEGSQANSRSVSSSKTSVTENIQSASPTLSPKSNSDRNQTSPCQSESRPDLLPNISSQETKTADHEDAKRPKQLFADELNKAEPPLDSESHVTGDSVQPLADAGHVTSRAEQLLADDIDELECLDEDEEGGRGVGGLIGSEIDSINSPQKADTTRLSAEV